MRAVQGCTVCGNGAMDNNPPVKVHQLLKCYIIYTVLGCILFIYMYVIPNNSETIMAFTYVRERNVAK